MIMKRKWTLFLMAALIMLPGCGSTAASYSPMTAARRFLPKERETLALGQETDRFDSPYAQAYIQDGNTRLFLYSAPLEQEEIQMKDEGDTFSSNTSKLVHLFPKQLSCSSPIQFNNDSAVIGLRPNSNKSYSATQETVTNLFGQERTAVTYENLFGEDGDFICYPTAFGLNTEIVIPKRTEQTAYRIQVKLPTLYPDTSSPDYILFKDAADKGEVRLILYTPLAADKKGNWSYQNTVELVDKDSKTGVYTLEYTVDSSFIQDKNTRYPVTLNQSIYFYFPKQPDTSAYEKTGEIPGHYLSPYQLLGDQTHKGEGNTFIRFDALNNLEIDPDSVQSAKYVFNNLFDLPEEKKISAYAVKADWCSINTRWFNRPPIDEIPLAEVIVKERGSYALDITPLFQEMLRNKEQKNAEYSIQNSFMIRCDTKNSNILLASGDIGLCSPLLEITLSE